MRSTPMQATASIPMVFRFFLAASAFCWFAGAIAGTARGADDILLADFEGETYGNWQIAGDAFGSGPTQKELVNQHPVAGFQGKRFVTSYHNGDDTTGTLTSPEFRIERKYVNLMVGGGQQPELACVNLMVGDKIVRTATGADDETLEWETWDVTEFAGQTAKIQVVDNAKGGWGHVNVDHIAMSEMRRNTDAPVPLYAERFRPQFHFSAAKGWLNDPNGLVFYKGEYHLFFQHNPKGNQWGNMTWGHAVSTDLFHWTQGENAILPDALGTIFSGSAVVDVNNTAGFQTGDEKVIVCIYTSAGGTSPESQGQPFTQSIAYSNDRGKTWTKYDKNPVLKNIVGANRDPKVFWHAPSKQWVMALYLDKNDYVLLGSPNLKEWTKLSDISIAGASECPDFFELPVDGDAKKTKWVFWAANNSYVLCSFDGKTLKPEGEMLQCHFGKNRYAAQSYSDISPNDGRRIQIAWVNGGVYPRMPFNQQMSVPVSLSLRTFPEGVRLCMAPVKELDCLHDKLHSWKGILKPDDPLAPKATGQLFDLRLCVEPKSAQEVGMMIRGIPVQYNVAEQKLTCLRHTATVALNNGCLSLRVLVDRSSIEIFAADGRVNMTFACQPAVEHQEVTIYAKGGDAEVHSFDMWELKSTWPQNPN